MFVMNNSQMPTTPTLIPAMIDSIQAWMLQIECRRIAKWEWTELETYDYW